MWCVCVCLCVGVCHSALVGIRGKCVGLSFFPPCGSHELNSGCQACWKACYLQSHLPSPDVQMLVCTRASDSTTCHVLFYCQSAESNGKLRTKETMLDFNESNQT